MRTLVLLTLVLSGCDCVSDASTGPGGNKPKPDSGTPDSGTLMTPDAGGPTMTGLVIEPPTALLMSGNGTKPTQQFVAKATLSDGTMRMVDAVFSATPQAIGTIDPIGGTFTASGEVGGTADIKATLMGFDATATVKVQLEWVNYGPQFDTTKLPKFNDPAVMDANKEPHVVYPLDDVVFPQNVASPDVQWLEGASGDLFRLVFKKTDVSLYAYAVDLGDHHYVPDPAAWRALAQTNPQETATLQVDRWESATSTVYPAPAPLHLKFARVSLTGSIYYWDIVAGRIVRIDDGTSNRTQFMPNPPVAVDGTHCVGCHAVSPSGRYMAGRLGGGENIGAVFDLTADLTPDPPPTVWPISTSPATTTWWFSSFSPDETRVVVSQHEELASTSMSFMDPRTGAIVPTANMPAGKVTHVAWSPDGKSIAYVDNFGTWGGDFTQGDISVVPVTAPDVLGSPMKLHVGSALNGDVPAGGADSYPTWSPDSKKLAFAHGSGCRSESHQAALYLMGADGSAVTRLTKGSGGAAAASNFQPRFSPFTGDGYYWLTFLSRRDYGNAQVGTRGADRQQIWVAAVKVNPQPGEDPSEVAYWLPGQATASRNIAAFWAPRACRAQGQMCSVGTECCSGVCATGICSPPPPDRCRLMGETCGGTGDCCPNRGLVCKLNACVIDIQ